MAFQVGITNSASDQIQVNFGGIDLTTLGLSSATVSGATAANAQSAIDAADTALAAISTTRAGFGAAINRLQITVSNIQTSRTNVAAADAGIKDVDVAAETAAMARNQVLSQAGVSVLAQANQAPQLALKLLG